MKQNRILLCVVSFLMVFNILVPVLHAQPASEMSEEEKNKKVKDAIEQFQKGREKYQHPKVNPVLLELEEAYTQGAEEAAKKFNAGEALKDDNGAVITKLEDAEKKGGEDAAKKFAKKHGREIKEGNKIRVEIILEPEVSPELFDQTLLLPYGGEVIGGAGNFIDVDIPVDKIRGIADKVKGIQFITLPGKPRPLSYQSEGVSLSGANSFTSAGINGSGIKVAVIDLYFKGLIQAINNGDVPANAIQIDCTGTSCISTTFQEPPDFNHPEFQHGTAVGEIVYDMAPGAQLYLIKVADIRSLKNAKDYCISNGIKVINHSVGWGNYNFYDGQCYNDNPVCTANNAYSNGILWVNAMGNHATQHYEATFTKSEPNCSQQCWHSTVPTINATVGETIAVDFTWNAWPTTNQDYDIY